MWHHIFLLTCFSVFRQYQDFLEDLEEDEALRKNVNIYRGEPLDAADFSLHQYPQTLQPFCLFPLLQLE